MGALLPYWIQRADLSATNFAPVDVRGGLKAFEGEDWAAALVLESTLNADGEENCPPGIGFVAPTGAILHICPRPDGRALVHYHAQMKRKLFGLITIPRSGLYTKEDVERSSIPGIIEAFFAARHEELLGKLAAT